VATGGQAHGCNQGAAPSSDCLCLPVPPHSVVHSCRVYEGMVPAEGIRPCGWNRPDPPAPAPQGRISELSRSSPAAPSGGRRRQLRPGRWRPTPRPAARRRRRPRGDCPAAAASPAASCRALPPQHTPAVDATRHLALAAGISAADSHVVTEDGVQTAVTVMQRGLAQAARAGELLDIKATSRSSAGEQAGL